MYAKVTLWLLGPALIVCWFGTLFEKTYRRIQINVDDSSLFLGLSILLAGWVIAIAHCSGSSPGRLASDYVNFTTKIGNKKLTRDQIDGEAGEKNEQVQDDSGSFKWETRLSAAQQRSLEHLIYEGKICLRDEQYSLPDKT